MVIYFSGNGNSESIAVALSRELGTYTVNLRGDALNFPSQFSANLEGKEPVIWVFPVYSWGVPPVMVNFIKSCNLEFKDHEHYLILTCGDDCGLAAKQWEKLIQKRGGMAKGKVSVFMPNTYVLMKGFDVDPKELEQQKLDRATSKINEIYGLIQSGFTDDKTFHGRFAWIKSRIVYPWFIRYAMSPKPFHVDDTCISCGKCARSCPTCNIVMKAGQDGKLRPQWGNNCALCLSCYHKCPVHAVQYGKETQNKGQYTNPM